MNPATGGVCKAVSTIILGLSKYNIDNEVISLDDPDADYLKSETFKIHAVGKGSGAWQYNNYLLKWLQVNLKNFDIVIVHGLWLYPGYAFIKMVFYL